MKIYSGLDNGCVLQRNEMDTCHVWIKGVTHSDKKITYMVKKDTTILNQYTLKSQKMTPEDNHFELSGILHSIPTGGPYEITITQEDQTLTFKDVLVGDVYLLAGQSNMEGIGLMDHKLAEHPMVKAFYLDDHWDVAADPLHELSIAIDPVHELIAGGPIPPKAPNIGVGPAMSFAQTLYQYNQVPVALIPCAHGGTSMDQWSPDHKDQGDKSLYGALLRRFEKAGSHVKGVFWHQGCNDTFAELSGSYYDKMVHFVTELRKDLNAPTLPFVMVQIARQCSSVLDATHWNKVQQAQYDSGLNVDYLATVPSIDLEMDDFIHISGASQNRLGKRCANAMIALFGDKAKKPQIAFDHIEVVQNTDNWNCHIEIYYNHVEGALTSSGRPFGFAISDGLDYNEKKYVYKTELDGNKIILHTTELAMDISNCVISYGFGYQPYCNIIDEADRSLPVLNQIPLGKKRYILEPCTKSWISDTLVDTLDLSTKERLLTSLETIEYRDFYYFNLNLPQPKEKYYLLPFEIKEDASLELMYDSNACTTLFIDGQTVGESTEASKDLHPEKHKVPFKVSSGVHYLMVHCKKVDTENMNLVVRFENTAKDVLPVWITK